MEIIPLLQKLWTGISTDFVATTQANSWHRESSLINVINPTLKVNVINPTLKTDISDLPPQANSWHRESSLESTRSNSCKVIIYDFGFKIFGVTCFGHLHSLKFITIGLNVMLL